MTQDSSHIVSSTVFSLSGVSEGNLLIISKLHLKKNPEIEFRFAGLTL